jgi:hypothetical protein
MINDSDDDALLWSRDKTRHELGDVSEYHLLKLERSGAIEVVRADRRTFVVASSVRRYVERLREAADQGGAA